MVLGACRSLKEKRPVSMKEIMENR
jgi:uncharacterized protein YlxP (DUF503 family)